MVSGRQHNIMKRAHDLKLQCLCSNTTLITLPVGPDRDHWILVSIRLQVWTHRFLSQIYSLDYPKWYLQRCVVNYNLCMNCCLKHSIWSHVWLRLFVSQANMELYAVISKYPSRLALLPETRPPTHHSTAGENLLSHSVPFYSHFSPKPTQKNALFLRLINATRSTMSN